MHVLTSDVYAFYTAVTYVVSDGETLEKIETVYEETYENELKRS